ncbi:alpha/beta fold hydrolase, partial [Nonomuraea longicatena]
DGWFRTGDRGRLVGGRLRLTGRSKEGVIVNGVNHPTQEVERALEELPDVRATSVAAVALRPEGSDTEQLAVAFSPVPQMDDEAGVHRALTAIRATVLRLWGFRPAVILPLRPDELTRTSLGKIERAPLREQLESGYFSDRLEWVAELTRRRRGGRVAPRGATERAVAGVYAELFAIPVEEVGATVSFLELGGTSLDVMRLKLRVEAAFPGAAVPVAAILRAPTVCELAALLDRGGHEGGYHPLVPLQQSGDGTPLFCVHPGVGEVLVFVNLARHFAGERPFYALRARGFGPGEPYFGSFGEMVSCYVAAIRERQEHGPYAVAGYSYGGAVAFEIAKELEAQGERVDFVGIVNLPPHIKGRMRELDRTEGALHLALFLGLVTPQRGDDLARSIRELPVAERIDAVLAAASRSRMAELDLDRAGFAAWVDVAQSLVKAARTYDPSGTVSSVTVFYADPLSGGRQDWLDHHLHAWDDFTRGENRYVEVPGKHYTVMDAEHVAVFQRIFREELARSLGR